MSFCKRAIKLVTFDANNTLFRTRGKPSGIYAKAANVYGVNVDSEKIDGNFRNSYQKYYQKYPNFGQVAGMSSRQWWELVVKDSFAGYEFNPGILDRICADLYGNFEKSEYWEVFPDVVPALTNLQEKGVVLGVISNFDERLISIMHNLNLNRYFSFVIPSRQTVFYKPLSEIFHSALSLAKLSPAETAHIGDDLNLDYKAAREAGMGAFVLLRQPTLTKTNHLLENNVPNGDIMHNLTELSDKFADEKQ